MAAPPPPPSLPSHSAADQPYTTHSDVNHPHHQPPPQTGPSSASPRVFVDAFQPAFARRPPTTTTTDKDAPPPPPQAQPAPTTAFHVAALGDPTLMGELPSTDPLSTLLSKHLPPHARPPRDLSGHWHAHSTAHDAFAPSSSSAAATATGNAGVDAVDAEAVTEAVRGNSWRRIATLARARIQSYHSSATAADADMGLVQVLEWWSVRLYALARLRLYSLMQTETDALWSVLEGTLLPHPPTATSAVSDAADTSFDSTLDPTSSPARSRRPTTTATPTRHRGGRSGAGGETRHTLASSPLVPFSLRVLRAKQPKYAGDLSLAIDAHVELVRYAKQWAKTWRRAARRCQSGSSEADEADLQERMWRDRARRMGIAVAALLVEAKDYTTATHLLTPLIEETETAPPSISSVHLLTTLARLYIQAGSDASTTRLVEAARRILHSLPSPSTSSTSSSKDDDERRTGERALQTAEALHLSFRGDYAGAEEVWRRLLSPPPQTVEGVKEEEREKEKQEAAAEVGLALAVFYQGRLDEPLRTLDHLLTTSPSGSSNVDPLLFNLCTLHELASSDATREKRRILAIVAQWAGEGAGTGCFKL